VDLDQIIASIVQAPKGGTFDLDAIVESVVAQSAPPIDLDTIIDQVVAPRPTFDQVIAGPWPPPLRSRYFVQADADVATLRLLRPLLAGRNVGVSSNVDRLETAPVLRRLMASWLEAGSPVYIDSGAYPRWRSGNAPPDWRKVFALYDRLIDRVGVPDLVAVTAPDAIGSPAETRRLQRSWKARIGRLVASGVRVVVPVQGRRASDLAESMRWILGTFGRSVWIGVPVRQRATTPLPELIEALLVVAREAPASLHPYEKVPRLHMLGLGASRRLEDYGLRLSLVYRILVGPHLEKLLAEREGVRDVARWLGTGLGNEARRRELLALVGCVQTRFYFPCPPGGRQSFGLTHPTVEEALRSEWKRSGLATLPTEQLLAHPVAEQGEIIASGRDAETERLTGRSDVRVHWYGFIDRVSDWSELCIGTVQQAEETDPCMIPDAWDIDDVAYLLREGGLDRIEVDAITVPLSAGLGKWIVLGRQKEATTPAWWKARPKRYRFAWNLLTLLWDRWQRERRSEYRLPSGSGPEGFRVSVDQVQEAWPARWTPPHRR
jgi:hypothetical protein